MLNLSRLYYQYIPEGKEYPVLCRRLEIEQNGWIKTFLRYSRGGFGKEEILLDWNEIAEQYGKLLSFFLMGQNDVIILGSCIGSFLHISYLLKCYLPYMQVMCTLVRVEFHQTTIS